MKKIFKFLSYTILSLVLLVILVGALGYCAVRFNFWPPSCSILPIPQAKRVCEFSKLTEAQKTSTEKPNFTLNVPEKVDLPSRKIVFMFDTWSINYNFNFFENTRWNIDSSFKRLQDLGANEVGVFSFIEAHGDKNNFSLQEVGTPYKYMRDSAITLSDMKKLAAVGKKYGLDVVIHYNVEADYTQGLDMNTLMNVGKGTGGDELHRKIAMGLGAFDDAKSKEWIEKWLDGIETSLLNIAKNAETAGIYGIDITPHYLTPRFTPYESLADAKFQEIIKKIRAIYHGKIFGTEDGKFGGFTSVPSYTDYLDGLYVSVPAVTNLPESASVAAIKSAQSKNLDELMQGLVNYKPDIFVVLSQASFDKAISGTPYFEFNDYMVAKQQGYKADPQLQAKAYEAYFENINDNKKFAGVAVNNYWWDDFMDPKYADPLISMSFSIRNKPAEIVTKSWWRKSTPSSDIIN
jgi:hypothetical protein